ncbi:LON peptidase substrate-binding domain-containing protein [Mycobacterium sp. SM1]|uniref:LON peptidase substrate-binding domain-containing protein n=1 Tax=Mycobacterium sp. SM1 TaxID=2816243 RepID=UPI001BD0F40F|nr:LON peptidase substrate-binding domain-containing protein [Mycobacterium sp. SM1]MBS4728462.1 LON peptidase substrate-binding domain-containing protein [Mycobacterium sp. SM1]
MPTGGPESFLLPMFPLESVLLPNEDLPLQIFEPRYTALVQDRLRSGDPRFGVVLIARGSEVGGEDDRCDVGALASIVEHVDLGAGRYWLRCHTGERIRVCEWLADDPYPRAQVRAWPDEPGEPVTPAQLREVEARVLALFERIAAARGAVLPGRDVLLGGGDAEVDAGARLYALASRIPIGPADRYAVLSAPSAARRLAALRDAVDTVAAMVEFQLAGD